MKNAQAYTGEELTKAIQEMESLQKSAGVSAASPVDKDILLSNPTVNLFEDPVGALMEEEVIQKASAPMLAMAAFQAEFAKGVQDTLIGFNKKIDELVKITLGNNLEVLKAQQAGLDLMKALGSAPATSFKTSEVPAEETIRKSMEENQALNNKPTPAFISSWLEKAVQTNRISPVVVATFESAQKLDDVTYAEICKDWNVSRGK